MAGVTRLEAQAWVDRLKVTRLAPDKGRAVADAHEVARAVRPDAVTVYACGDRYAAAYSRALLARPVCVAPGAFCDRED